MRSSLMPRSHRQRVAWGLTLLALGLVTTIRTALGQYDPFMYVTAAIWLAGGVIWATARPRSEGVQESTYLGVLAAVGTLVVGGGVIIFVFFLIELA